MKKTYIIPTLKVRGIKTPSILAGSGGEQGINDGEVTEQRAKEGGFDWGDTWSNNEESEN